MPLTTLALQGTSGGSSAESISQGSGYGYGYSNSQSDGWSQDDSYSIGQSWGSGWSNDWGWSNSAQNSISQWGGSANGESWNHTYGREASAQDIINAYTANSVERELWALQAAYNAQEAEKSRQFQAQMSNTAYQRAVEDLKKAGLNPILAAGVASSTPIGATASSGLSSAHKANAYAESTGGSYNKSSDYGYSKSQGHSNSQWGGSSGYENKSYNKSESHGKSENHSKSNSYNYNESQNSASSWEKSSYTNNIKEVAENAINTLGNLGIVDNIQNKNKNLNKTDKAKTTLEKSVNNYKLRNYHNTDTYKNENRTHSR